MEYCIVHYGEIGLKKGNRGFFEKCLVENIKDKIKGISVKKSFGYFVLSAKKNVDWEELKNVFGISHFFVSRHKCKKDMDEIKKALEIFLNGEDLKFESFKINSQRHDKNFNSCSEEMNNILGEIVRTKFGKIVDLENPDAEIFVKVCDDGIYFSCKKNLGLGGLPVGSTGNALCLLSGGIDSPVAAFLAMKRGLKLNFIHFKSQASLGHQGEEKITEIVKVLSKFQKKSELIFVNSEFQKEIVMKIPSRYRMIVFRRLILRVADRFSDCLILGDNLGQVASQTLENLKTSYCVSKSLILSPLIGFDKKEIIKIARQIGTYEVSIKEYADCCSFFVPKHPELKSTEDVLEEVEKEFDVEGVVEKCAEGCNRILV